MFGTPGCWESTADQAGRSRGIEIVWTLVGIVVVPNIPEGCDSHLRRPRSGLI